MNDKLERLLRGQTIITKAFGNSMMPIIKSGQPHKIEPIKWEQCEIGDIVYCKVKGKYYTHLVKAKDKTKGVLIANNRGFKNGWTKSVYGKVIKIYEDGENNEH